MNGVRERKRENCNRCLLNRKHLDLNADGVERLVLPGCVLDPTSV
jgi:hypothetical protein